ncbi:LacI family transcriptional regulator [Herbiconiux sp. L3-i23]|nr:LacI family transcriptional regulator [Herbiconiux sp. L3-i23]
MATMVDVARHAQVSISTVSHVLNGTRKVEPHTRKRVIDAIEATGYRQDALARAMRRSQTDSIGLVVSDAGEPAFAEMVHGVEHAAAENGLTLLLANSAEDADREGRAVRALLNRRVDGVILARAAASSDALVDELAKEKTPTILLDRVFPELALDQVGADNRDSMRRMVLHLAQAGHRRFCLVAGDMRVPTLRERRDGFFDALHEMSIPTDSGGVEILLGDDAALGRRLDAALSHDARPTAIIASSTPLAALALQHLKDNGLRVPTDIAFATFDGFNHPDLFEPRLTTIRQPAFDMGASAVRLLVDRLANDPGSPRTVRLQQRLELRSSTEGFEFA